MRNSGRLASALLVSGLILSATPAFAVYTGITIPNGAQEISTITIKLPGGDPVTAQQNTPGHFGINTDQPLTPGIHGTATVTTTDGKTHTVPAFVGEDGGISVYLPEGNCFVPGFCGTAGMDYAHVMPNQGSDGDLWGLSLQGMIPLGGNASGQLDFGYHSVSGSGFHLNSVNGAASVLFNGSGWRAGPTFGIQSNSTRYYSMDTYNYGGFVDFFFPGYTLSGKLGGFSSNTANNDGFYIGGGATGFLTSNLALSATWDHTGFSAANSSDEDDLTGTIEYMLSQRWPVSIYTGATRTSFSNSSFTVNTFFLGFRFYCDDNGATTLEERHDTGTTSWGTSFYPLTYRF